MISNVLICASLDLLTGIKGRCWVKHEIQIQKSEREKRKEGVCKKEAKMAENKAHLSFYMMQQPNTATYYCTFHLV